MTFKMQTLATARAIAQARDAARTMDERRYQEWLFDAAVQDWITVCGWYRKAARRRLRRTRRARRA